MSFDSILQSWIISEADHGLDPLQVKLDPGREIFLHLEQGHMDTFMVMLVIVMEDIRVMPQLLSNRNPRFDT